MRRDRAGSTAEKGGLRMSVWVSASVPVAGVGLQGRLRSDRSQPPAGPGWLKSSRGQAAGALLTVTDDFDVSHSLSQFLASQRPSRCPDPAPQMEHLGPSARAGPVNTCRVGPCICFFQEFLQTVRSFFRRPDFSDILSFDVLKSPLTEK